MEEQAKEGEHTLRGLLDPNPRNYEAVKRMYVKYGFIPDTLDLRPTMIDAQTSAFRMKALREELSELSMAYTNQDLPAVSDALVDMVVFVLGTAALHHLPWEELFDDVMRANNAKVLGDGNKKRNVHQRVDLVKPEGWQGPRTEEVLRRAGWK